jgi:hypothetical protein
MCTIADTTKNITQKDIKMSNMVDITKIHNTEIYKNEQHGPHQQILHRNI